MLPTNQLKMEKKDCGFRHIRFHGLFHEDMAVVTRDKDGKLSFNFQYVDLLFDSLLEIGICPIVELGLMPDIMAKEKAYHFRWKINISMPEKMEEWYRLVEETVRHFTEHYGKEEVKNWFFEVWREPNHPAFFTEYDNPDAYFQLYEQAANAVKSVCSDVLETLKGCEGHVDLMSYWVYTDILEENYPVHLSRSQAEELKEKAKPLKTEFEVMSDDSGELSFALEQTENQIDFVTIAL